MTFIVLRMPLECSTNVDITTKGNLVLWRKKNLKKTNQKLFKYKHTGSRTVIGHRFVITVTLDVEIMSSVGVSLWSLWWVNFTLLQATYPSSQWCDIGVICFLFTTIGWSSTMKWWSKITGNGVDSTQCSLPTAAAWTHYSWSQCID